jgi:flagellar biosynthetic protein FliR
MGADALTGWVVPILLLSLRIAPVFAFAPPFNLIRTPVLFRMLFGVAAAACLASANPEAAAVRSLDGGTLLAAAAAELILGATFVMVFHLAYGALQVAGRTVDIQAGFGLSLLIDPSTRAQTPLVGTLFVYAAAAIFFAMDGHLELVALLAASLDAVPVGSHMLPTSLGPLVFFITLVFALAFGVAGGVILALFLTDVTIAFLSRTVPQMNVLLLGFQVKTLVMLAVLPVTFATSGVLLARMSRVALEALPRLM